MPEKFPILIGSIVQMVEHEVGDGREEEKNLLEVGIPRG